ncbi:MAG: alanine dehydrogenase [Atribacterota bacterium]|nr:alanine dehydrogenase [Atribacterota bacterium]
MIIGIPKEIKNNENRVAITPAGVNSLFSAGHKIIIEKLAGSGSGISDQQYLDAGAVIYEKAEEIYNESQMILKVKEPLKNEYSLIRENQIIFTFFHFAASLELTTAMVNQKCICIAYETIEDENHSLPLLSPMSEIAGKMAGHVAAYFLALPMGGKGVLMGGVPGVKPAKILVIGGGTVGTNAAKIAAGIGANVIIFDINLNRLKYLEDILPKNINLLVSNKHNIENEIKDADALIGAVLVPGSAAPKIVSENMIKMMQPNSIVVDVAIDQGGCIETSKPTSHSNPVFKIHNILHYCVTNMPGAFARTSTFALTNATLPYILEIANDKLEKTILRNKSIANGLNIYKGKITNKPIADLFNLHFYNISDLF